MKLLFLFGTFAALCTPIIFASEIETGDWGAQTNHVKMSINLASGTNEVAPSSKILLNVKIENDSTNMEYYCKFSLAAGPLQGISFKIQDPNGKDISPIYSNNEFVMLNAVAMELVPPNETKSFPFSLNSIMGFRPFDQPGSYRVTAMMRGHFQGTNQPSFTITSNTLRVSVRNNEASK